MGVEVSALIVPVPDADPLIGALRDSLDSGAALGVPSHVTILYPFMPTSALDADAIARLRDMFASIDAFRIALTSIGWFGRDVVYLRPEPDDAFRQMTALVSRRWPRWPPYEGKHGDPTPHVTIGDNGDLPAMLRAAREVRGSLPLPITVSEVQLYAGTADVGSWHHRQSFPLRTRRR